MSTTLLEPGDERLRRLSVAVRFPDETLDRLLADLNEVLVRQRAIGVSAPQIGTNRQVALVRVADRAIVLVNPRVLESSGSQVGWEGCLSIPERVGWVERPQLVVVEARDQRGRLQRYQAAGLAARAMIHEIDHLTGRLYVDGLDPELIVDTQLHPTPPSMPPQLR